MRMLLLGTILLIEASCQKPPPASDRATGQLTFRVECEADTPDAITEEYLGRTYWFGPPMSFELQYAGPTLDASGLPAIAFDIEEPQKADFEAMTERSINLALAIYVGEQFISAPTVYDALPGAGIIFGGLHGFSPEEQARLLKILRGS